MIYFNESLENCLDCLIESAYLSEEICYKNSESTVYVCPDNPTYITKNKTVVITKEIYPKEKLYILIKNNCKIISRINLKESIDGIEVFPYILRPSFSVMWNGCYLDYNKFDKSISSYTNILGSGKFSSDSGILYFPKILNLPKEEVLDLDGNLTGLGWACQQVGINIIKNTPFIDLDIIKTKKTLFKET